MRAGNGDGSIKARQTKTKGTVWDIQLTIKLSDGTSHRVTKRGLPTRQAAIDWRNAESRKRRAIKSAGAEALTVPVLVDRYLEGANGLVGSTLKSYTRMQDLYIRPLLKVRATALTPKRLQAFADDVAAMVQKKGEPGSATTLLALATVRSAYAWAMGPQQGLLQFNPIADAAINTPPPTNDRRAFTNKEVLALLAVASKRSRIIWQLFLEAAPRSGEALALDWGDFDLDVNRVRFSRILSPESNYKEIVHRTKGKGARVAYLSDALCADLRALKEEQGASAHDPVFTTVRGPRRRMGMISMRQMWWKDTEAAGLKGRTPHELRHTWATMSLANGVNVQVVAEVLGHKSLDTVLNYLHSENSGTSASNALRMAVGY